MRIMYLSVYLLVGSISCNGGSSISDDLGVSDLAMAGEGTDLGSMNDSGSSTSGRIIFQCPGSSGGVCIMNADGSNRQTLVSTGFEPDGNAAGEILYYTVSGTLGTIQKRLANGSITALANGSNPHWVP